MIKYLHLCFSVLMLLSCGGSKQKKSVKDVFSKITNDSIKKLDLSNMRLKKIPNLSDYYIEELILKYNLISTINNEHLPSGIQKIDVSYNKLEGYIKLLEKGTLKYIDLSNNNIEKVYIGDFIKNLNVSNNNLNEVQINYCGDKILDTLNISNNLNLSNIVHFRPSSFKQIYHDNIKNKKELIWIFHTPIVD